MLRAFVLAAVVFAAVPSVGVLAEPSGTDAPAAKTTETQSGTTMFFGDASKAAAPEAAKQWRLSLQSRSRCRRRR